MTWLTDSLRANRRGAATGVYSVCTANPHAIAAAMHQAVADEQPVLIEATSNQVDQNGGYTGMTPERFVGYVGDIAREVGLPPERVVLGGDHLGPNVWQALPAETAMANAHVLIRDYVAAGFAKIHLDTSMPLGDDPGGTVDDAVVAERAADLCRTAEATYRDRGRGPAPHYVIGTEVPIPGGAQEALDELTPTRTADVRTTIEVTHDAFLKRGLDAAWERVIAVVVQPGVEFGDATVVAYQPERARNLARFIESVDRLVYEAHSTDYQTPAALEHLVRDHFAILKVGPWLTFAFREAVFALARIERELLAGRRGETLSNLETIVDDAMTRDPRHWRRHYHGEAHELALKRVYSYSDRIRYYWPQDDIAAALARLFANLERHPVPDTLLSQYLPDQYRAVRDGRIPNTPVHLVRDRIMAVTAIYARATGQRQDSHAAVPAQ